MDESPANGGRIAGMSPAERHVQDMLALASRLHRDTIEFMISSGSIKLSVARMVLARFEEVELLVDDILGWTGAHELEQAMESLRYQRGELVRAIVYLESRSNLEGG